MFLFSGHSAILGCSKCKKKFPGKIGERNYSGFDRSKWDPRTSEGHRQDMEKVNACKTPTARSAKESEIGSRYSVLSELPYVNLISMVVIDPMHNLFLGKSLSTF